MIIILSVFLLACSELETFAPEGFEKVVVNAFLYEGEPVDDIRITKLITYGDSDSSSFYLNDLQVYLNKDDSVFSLIAYPGDTGYYWYPGNDLEILSGEEYQIEFSHGGETIRSTTTIPGPPATISISSELIYMSKILEFQDIFNRTQTDPIELTWQNPDADYYYLVIECMEQDAELINQMELPDTPFAGVNERFIRITEPTNADFYQIQTMNLEYFGEYMIRVFRTNEEFARMFESLSQDSRDLNEPYSNIINGLGIFTGFTVDTLFFRIVEN